MSVARSAIKKQPVDRNTSMLQTFIWEGADKRGVKMKGEQTARNANMLRAELRRQGIVPSVVKQKPKPLFGAAGKKITPKDIAFFSRQMATMMKSGVPIVSSLEIIGEGHKNPRMKKMVGQIRTDIEGDPRSTSPSAHIPFSLTSSTATLSARAKALAYWRQSSTRSLPTKRTLKP